MRTGDLVRLKCGDPTLVVVRDAAEMKQKYGEDGYVYVQWHRTTDGGLEGVALRIAVLDEVKTDRAG